VAHRCLRNERHNRERGLASRINLRVIPCAYNRKLDIHQPNHVQLFASCTVQVRILTADGNEIARVLSPRVNPACSMCSMMPPLPYRGFRTHPHPPQPHFPKNLSIKIGCLLHLQPYVMSAPHPNRHFPRPSTRSWDVSLDSQSGRAQPERLRNSEQCHSAAGQWSRIFKTAPRSSCTIESGDVPQIFEDLFLLGRASCPPSALRFKYPATVLHGVHQTG